MLIYLRKKNSDRSNSSLLKILLSILPGHNPSDHFLQLRSINLDEVLLIHFLTYNGCFVNAQETFINTPKSNFVLLNVVLLQAAIQLFLYNP